MSLIAFFTTEGMLMDALINIGIFILTLLGLFSVFLFTTVRTKLFTLILNAVKSGSVLHPRVARGNKAINDLLDTVVSETGAYRACVFQFHNGENFVLSNHCWKMTCTYERLHNGVESKQEANSRLYVSAYTEFVLPIVDLEDNELEPGIHRIPKCSTCCKDTPCTNRGTQNRVLRFDFKNMRPCMSIVEAEKQGVAVVYTISLVHPKKKNVFGFLAIQYQDLFGEEERLAVEEKMCSACKAASTIQFYLTTDFSNTQARKPFKQWLLDWF